MNQELHSSSTPGESMDSSTHPCHSSHSRQRDTSESSILHILLHSRRSHQSVQLPQYTCTCLAWMSSSQKPQSDFQNELLQTPLESTSQCMHGMGLHRRLSSCSCPPGHRRPSPC